MSENALLCRAMSFVILIKLAYVGLVHGPDSNWYRREQNCLKISENTHEQETVSLEDETETPT